MEFLLNPYRFGGGGPTYYNDFSNPSLADFSQPAGAWSVSSGQAVSGTNGYLIYDGATFADGEVTTTLMGGDQAGILIRFTDMTHNILFVFRDNSSSIFTNSANIYIINGGSYFQIAANSLGGSFTRGSPFVVRIVYSGPTMTVYGNGASLFSYTDSTILSAGKSGLYASNSTGIFDDIAVRS